METKSLKDLLKKGDMVAVSNITGREASKVSKMSQKYCENIIGGWALGKGGQSIETADGSIPVYATFEELLKKTPKQKQPNKILIYSPPEAVYGEVKEVIKFGKEIVETIFIVTENVAIEVTAKIYEICTKENIDVIGCNTLGMINVHEHIRIGAVGGTAIEETFKPGSVTIISNSGNMVNTIASYLLSSGMGTSFGISTGKDKLILFPLKRLLKLAEKDKRTKLIVLYVEPGGLYEHEAIEMIRKDNFSKPIVVYVAGIIAEQYNISLGHTGAVIEGESSSAKGKQKAFDDYFGISPYQPRKRYKKNEHLKAALTRGIRVVTLHHIPMAVSLVVNHLDIKKDRASMKFLRLNPWFVNLGELGKLIPSELSLSPGVIPEPYNNQFKIHEQTYLTSLMRQSMRNTSHASSNDGAIPRIYGYPMTAIMKKYSFTAALILYWTGCLPDNPFEERLAEMTLIASLTNGPGTISAQGAKLSTSAGNNPNTVMIATLATLGVIHGGNGAKAVRFLLTCFQTTRMSDAYSGLDKEEIKKIAQKAADNFKKKKTAAKDAGVEYERIPCLGHPVFHNDPVNYDPREQVIYNFIKESGKQNIFLEFYHYLAQALKDNGCTRKVLAVNLDAALACVWLGICWKKVYEKQMTVDRVKDIPFIAFALSRTAGGAGEFLDHQDFGTEMDMRIPVDECKSLTRPKEI